MLALNVDADGKIRSSLEKGAAMKQKRTYEKPELQKLGLLRDLTKMSFNRNF
jgi:hypothetical protein